MTAAQFNRELEKHGATLDVEMLDADVLQVDAPRGKVFIGNGCHTIVVQYRNRGSQSWKHEAYADVAATMSYGIEECSDPECDICNE